MIADNKNMFRISSDRISDSLPLSEGPFNASVVSDQPIFVNTRLTQNAWTPNALWRHNRIAKTEPVMPVNEDFDQRVKNFDEKSGEDKRVAGRALIEKHGAKGIEYLGELFQTVLNQKTANQNTLYVIVTVLAEVPEEWIGLAIETLEKLDRSLTAPSNANKLGPEALEKLNARILTSKILLLNIAPAVFIEKSTDPDFNWKTATQRLVDHIKSETADFKTYATLIDLYLLHREPTKARKVFDRLMTGAVTTEHDMEIRCLNGAILVAENHPDEATFLLEPFLETETAQYPQIYAILGESYRKSKKWNQAEAMYAKAHQSGKLDGMLFKMGTTYEHRKEWKKAKALYEVQIELSEQEGKGVSLTDKSIAPAYTRLGVALWMLGDLEDAEKKFRWAISRQEDYADAYYNLASLLYEKGKKAKNVPLLKEAIENYRLATKKAGSLNQYARYGIAQCLEKIGQLMNDKAKQQTATQQFETLGHEDPPYPKALLKMVEVHYRHGDFTAMVEVAKKASDLLPEDITAAYQLAESYRMNKDYPLAAEEYGYAWELVQDEKAEKTWRFQIFFGSADAQLWSGRTESAQYFFNFIRKEIGPKSPVEWDHLVLLAYILKIDSETYQKIVQWASQHLNMTPQAVEENTKKSKALWELSRRKQ